MQEQENKNKNGNPVQKRTYFEITGHLTVPLLIGSGENNEADIDVLVNPDGCPFLPGTSLAGVLKQYTKKLFNDSRRVENQFKEECFEGTAMAEYLFGKPQDGNSPGHQSRVFVYDADLKGAKIGFRDGVRLDEFKTAADMAKYEMQVVEPGAEFTICLELVQRENDPDPKRDLRELQLILKYLQSNGITIGARSRRGFGRLSVDSVKLKTFAMKNPVEREAWLDWHWRKKCAFEIAEILDWAKLEDLPSLSHRLNVPLKVQHTLLIRQYADVLSDTGTVDYHQLQSRGFVVIPGSSWMGAIRARIAKIIQQMYPEKSFSQCQRALNSFFGSWDECKNVTLLPSKVGVEESVINKAHLLPITRNAIDRFTGGAISGALYTAEVVVYGDTELKLHWPCAEEKSDAICGLLLWAIKDLQNGLLAVGGETAVGRGIFEGIDQVNLDGCPVDKDKEAECLRKAACWCREEAFKIEKGR